VTLDTLSQFISAIERLGELARVREPVRVHLELAEIADRVMKQPGGGHALLFEHPVLADGSRSAYPVAINLFGSMKRIALALGVDDLDEHGARITKLLELKIPEGLLGRLALLPRLLEIARFPPRVKGGTSACQEIVWRGDEIDLRKLPIITCWPKDAGPYITLPMVISKDPTRGIRNVGMYRVQLLGKDTLAMHWQRHKVGAAHWRAMAERGETMPVAIAIGADPASIYTASAPLPPTVDEFLFAGFLRSAPVHLARALTCDLEVPAEAEFVIEGHIDPREPLVTEGPFGDHTGFYSEADLYPLVHVTAVTMRRNPVYATTIVGRPPGPREPLTPAIFHKALPPGYALAAMSTRVTPDGAGGSVVSTETRVFANSPSARRRFAVYWRLIYPGSALIRRMLLRAIERRSTSPSEP